MRLYLGHVHTHDRFNTTRSNRMPLVVHVQQKNLKEWWDLYRVFKDVVLMFEVKASTTAAQKCFFSSFITVQFSHGPDFIKLLSRIYCLAKFFAKQSMSGAPVAAM